MQIIFLLRHSYIYISFSFLLFCASFIRLAAGYVFPLFSWFRALRTLGTGDGTVPLY